MFICRFLGVVDFYALWLLNSVVVVYYVWIVWLWFY